MTSAPVDAPLELLERDEASATLVSELEHARLGVGRTVLVAGEAGVGKTSLVRSFTTRHESEVRVVWGACEALFTPRPLGPVYDIVQELGSPSTAAGTGTGGDRTRFFGELLAELGGRPTVAVFEDVHWADEATLDALKYLGRRIASTPSLLVLTFRDDEVGATHPLRTVLGDLPTGTTTRLSLSPLSPGGVDELARRAGRAAGGLYEVTGGNPFFVTEVLAAGGGDIPETVVDAVLARASRLSEGGRRLLDAAAVVPGSVEIWLLEELAAEDFAHLAECLASGMLTPTGGGIGFRHELARLAIERALTPDRRISLHQAALRALADQPPDQHDLSALAHHADAAGSAEAVLRYAPAAAARASAVGAHREAAEQYARALSYSHSSSKDEQAELYSALSYEYYLMGDFHEALAAAASALDLHAALGDLHRQGESLHALSRVYWSFGRTRDAEDAALRAVALLEPLSPSRGLAKAYAELSTLALTTGEYDLVATWSARAADVAEQLDDRETLALVRVNQSAVEYILDRENGRQALERELELAISSQLDEVAAWAYTLLVLTAVRARDHDVADRYLEPGFEFCRDRDLGNFRQALGAARAQRLLDLGEWSQSADAAGLVLSTARTTGFAPVAALTTLGLVRARRGDPDVWDPLDRALAGTTPTGEFRRIALVAAARAEAAWLTGDLERTAAEARAAYDLSLGKRHRWHAGELAYWLWRSGVLDTAPEWIARPYAQHIAGDWRGAASFWRSRRSPYETAWALADGDVAAKREAHAEFMRLGAKPAATKVARSLQSAGARVPRGPRASTRANPAQLTPREVEVLELMADGLRNAEIADRLVVSPRTVDHHVSAILRKLGARTRLEAVAAATRLGLTQDR